MDFDWKKTDAVLVSSPISIAYLTNFFGFSRCEREAYLFITKDVRYILTDGRYTEAVGREVGQFKLLQVSSKSPLEHHLKQLIKKHKISKIDVEADSLTMNEYLKLSKIGPRLGEFEGLKRSVKEPGEIALIEAACDLGDSILKNLLSKVRPNSTETRLATLFEISLIKSGARPSFPTIIAFGPHSSSPHHSPIDSVLGKPVGQFLLIDSGVELNHYCSDMTRTYFYGQPDEEKKKIYQTVLDAQSKAAEALEEMIKKGQQVKGRDIDKIARDYIASSGFSPYTHGLGHGIGLEVHEEPRLSPRGDSFLTEGMVFSIEPGIYIPDFGGVRIEDLFVIENNGLRQLSKSPKKLSDIIIS